MGPTQGWPGRCPPRCWDAERTGRGRTFEVCPGLWWRLQRVAWRHRCEGTSGVVTCLPLGPPRAAGTAGAVPSCPDRSEPSYWTSSSRRPSWDGSETGPRLRFRRTSTISGSRLRPILGRPSPTIWPLPGAPSRTTAEVARINKGGERGGLALGSPVTIVLVQGDAVPGEQHHSLWPSRHQRSLRCPVTIVPVPILRARQRPRSEAEVRYPESLRGR